MGKDKCGTIACIIMVTNAAALVIFMTILGVAGYHQSEAAETLCEHLYNASLIGTCSRSYQNIPTTTMDPTTMDKTTTTPTDPPRPQTTPTTTTEDYTAETTAVVLVIFAVSIMTAIFIKWIRTRRYTAPRVQVTTI